MPATYVERINETENDNTKLTIAVVTQLRHFFSVNYKVSQEKVGFSPVTVLHRKVHGGNRAEQFSLNKLKEGFF